MTTQSNAPDWAHVETAGGERHLPVYLLLDTSSSMEGAPIESVRQGLEQFQSEVSKDQFARNVVKVGMITFDQRGTDSYRRLSATDADSFRGDPTGPRISGAHRVNGSRCGQAR